MGDKNKKRFDEFLERSQKLKDEFKADKTSFSLKYSTKEQNMSKYNSNKTIINNESISEIYSTLFPNYDLENIMNKFKK